jgi:hypothetical protein
MIIRTPCSSPLLVFIGLLPAAVSVLAAASSPAELDHQYPKGSITTAAEAQRALVDAAAAGGALDRAFEAERIRCAKVFLATQCLDDARRVHAGGSAQIRRIEVEAHDLQRHQAADERQVQREAAVTPPPAATHADRTPSAHGAAAPKGAGDKAAGDAAADAARQQAQEIAARERYVQRQSQHDRDQAQRVQIQIRDSADNAQRFQDKQAHARAYAVEKAKAREENEKSRAEHEQERKKKFAPEDSGSTASQH